MASFTRPTSCSPVPGNQEMKSCTRSTTWSGSLLTSPGSACRNGYARPARDVWEERRHLPFQVLDASAIGGIGGLAGEGSSMYSCIQIYIRPLEERRGGGGCRPPLLSFV